MTHGVRLANLVPPGVMKKSKPKPPMKATADDYGYRQRLPESLNDALTEIAAERKQSKNQLVVDVLQAFVEHRDLTKEEFNERMRDWIKKP